MTVDEIATTPGDVIGAGAPAEELDPRRWIVLAVIALSVAIAALDSTVLNVALPTMARDLDSTVSSLEWVITGYSLTVASLLMIGGKLCDLFGHRRMFILGAGMFAVGSLLAALAGSVPQLILGEAIIEGMGAALMTPASLAILSSTFRGRERAVAFGIWGAIGGASGALGPVLGGVLTTNASWRWSFGINVIVAPLAVVGALLVVPKLRIATHRPKIDKIGAALVAVGFFSFVFAISEGSRYGWFEPVRSFSVAGALVWPGGRLVSITIVAVAVTVAAFGAFYVQERRLTRAGIEPLFDFGLLRIRTFRYGVAGYMCITTCAGILSFVLPVFLQEGKKLSAQTNGLWQFPIGFAVLVAAPIGARAVRRWGPIPVMRVGLAMSAAAFTYLYVILSSDLTFWRLLPGLATHGLGIGVCFSQLTNVTLSEIPHRKMGIASASNATTRNLGFALGVAIVGSALAGQVVDKAASAFGRLPGLSPAVRTDAVADVRSRGVSFSVPRGASGHERALLDHAFADSLASSARLPLLIGLGTIILAFATTWRFGPGATAAGGSSDRAEAVAGGH